MIFQKYRLTANRLCLGERTKGGRYKPTAKTLRYSQLCGALKHRFGFECIHSVGVLDDFKVEFLEYTLKDRSCDKSKIPLRIEFLTDVSGTVYITGDSIPKDDQEGFDMVMGAMISKGFGDCHLAEADIIDTAKEIATRGILNTRIPINAEDENELRRLVEFGEPTKFLREVFYIRKVFKPNLGYLFDPITKYTGKYVIALFENSKVEALQFLLVKGGN